MRSMLFFTTLALLTISSWAFTPAATIGKSPITMVPTRTTPFIAMDHRREPRRTSLQMSDKGGTERTRKTKKGVSTIIKDKTETKSDQEQKKEEMWRVVLHNDEVHTFNYVIRSLQKVIGTLDRKKSFDICVVTHGTGKATITKTWKEQAMKYCLGLQRQGLTASIAPDSKFEGGDDPNADGAGEG